MPEGDVVWRTARRLDAAQAGRVIEHCDVRWPSLAETDLTGREVLEVASAGKHLLTRVEGGLTLHSHLRMEGSWHVHRTGEPWASARSASGVRIVLGNAEWTAVGHRLGLLELLPTRDEHTVVGHLGPDVLGPSWDSDEVLRRLREQPDRPVGDALLDQRVLAGVGTFYMAEACFLRGVTPWTPVAEVPALDRLVEVTHRLLDVNKDRAVQATTGDTRPGREQWVHSRSGRPCRRCGTAVRVAGIGAPPRERTAFWCPSCQQGPSGPDDGRPQRPLGSRPREGRRTTGGRTYRPAR
jgi:endonuclease VIII